MVSAVDHRVGVARVHDVVNGLPALLRHVADLNKVAQLLVVGLCVRVNHLVRLASCID